MKNLSRYIFFFIVFICLFSCFNNSTGPGESSTVTDIDGNEYQTLVIGEQEWMIENLKVTHYNNGDQIQNLTDSIAWVNTNDGAYCIYNNNETFADTYGNLYNWYAVNDSRGLAPEGWHVPTDEEIIELEMYLGMSEIEANSAGYRGTNEGSKLAGRADLWIVGMLELDPEFDTSGFCFLPAGYRYYYGSGHFFHEGQDGFIWSSTESQSFNNYAWCRLLTYDCTLVNRFTIEKQSGLSVRCVRD